MRDAARHCSTEQTKKAQNDRRLVPNVGLGVATEIRQEPPFFPQKDRSIKVGWPTVKVPLDYGVG